MSELRVKEINLRRCNITTRYNIGTYTVPYIMLFIRGELHIVRCCPEFRSNRKMTHLVFSKSMILRTFTSSGEHFKEWFTQNSFFSEARNSIIVHQRRRNHTRLIEYGLATNQWNEMWW